MKHSHAHVSRWVALGAYVFALTLVLGPLVDLTTTVLPFRMADVNWRYGFVGLAAGYLHTPLLGFGLAVAVAIWQEDSGILRALGILGTMAAGALIPIMGIWALDLMQIRELREPEGRTAVLIGGAIQMAKYAGACLTLALVGIGISRTVKSQKASGRSAPAPGSPGSLRRD